MVVAMPAFAHGRDGEPRNVVSLNRRILDIPILMSAPMGDMSDIPMHGEAHSDANDHPQRRYPGPRRCPVDARGDYQPLPVASACLCRWRICRTTTAQDAQKRSANGRSRSSTDLTPPTGSKCCPAAGWSNAPSHGWDATVASLKTSKTPSRAPPHGSSCLPSSSSPDASQPTAIKQDNYESDSWIDRFGFSCRSNLARTRGQRHTGVIHERIGPASS